jgi:lipopolysaccharide export system permease protein
MLKKIDIYIIRKFLGTFFLSIALIIIIVIAFDISENIDDFIERQAPVSAILFTYYFNFIPYFVNLFSPLFTFIAVVYFTSRMAGNMEIAAILTCGISYRRMLRPFMIAAIILAGMNFWLSNFLIPPANKKRQAFEEQYIKAIRKTRGRNVHIQLSPGKFAFVETYSLEDNIGYRFTLESVDFSTGLTSKLHAEVIRWDSINQSWKLQRCIERTFENEAETLTRYAEKDTVLNMTPNDFRSDTYLIDLMNFAQLRDFIRREKIKGSESIVFYEVEQYRRTAFPFATIILTLIGVALSGRKSKGGTGLHLGIGLSLSFGYILFMQISTTFAIKADFPPLLAVWIPNLVFLLAAFWLIYKAPK